MAMANEIVRPCEICRTDGSVVEIEKAELLYVRCPVCAEYRISRSALTIIENSAPTLRRKLCGIIRRNFNLSSRPFYVNSESLEAIAAKDPTPNTVPEKQDALILDIARRSLFPGCEVGFGEPDFVVVNSSQMQEVAYHIGCLVDRGLAQRNSGMACTLTGLGWDEAARLQNPAAVEKADIFVAMAFDPALAKAWTDGLIPGIQGAGYRPKRVDSDEHNDKIDDRIMAGIRSCFAVVVDVTQQNRGAYFEAGFAIGLGRPVVWTVRGDDLANVHFDTRQFNHVVWSTPEELALKLQNRLLGVFGRGPVID